jgi:hypothetical protein
VHDDGCGDNVGNNERQGLNEELLRQLRGGMRGSFLFSHRLADAAVRDARFPSQALACVLYQSKYNTWSLFSGANPQDKNKQAGKTLAPRYLVPKRDKVLDAAGLEDRHCVDVRILQVRQDVLVVEVDHVDKLVDLGCPQLQ